MKEPNPIATGILKEEEKIGSKKQTGNG